MQPPRSKAVSTRLLLLLELHHGRHTKLRTLAERLDLTVQAVSDYLKRLTNEGLVEHVAGAWKPTKSGTAYVHSTMEDLRRFVDEGVGQLRIIRETYALADRALHAEEPVGLTMRDGRLYTAPVRKAASRGIARTEADAGQLVLVGDLEGVVELRPAPITLVAHPDFPTGAPLDRARKDVRAWLAGTPRTLVAAHALTSLAWVWALGLEVDLEFAPIEAAREAATRGVPVLYFVPHHERPACEAQLATASQALSEPPPLRSVRL